MKRFWINQPSTLQSMHPYHGTLVFVPDGDHYWGDSVVVGIVSPGDVSNMMVPCTVLEPGWPKHLREKVFK